MARSSKLITSEVIKKAEQGLKQLGKSGLLARKLHAIIAASKHSIKEVAQVYDISRTSLTAWITRLQKGTLDKLCAPPERKRKSIMNDNDRELVKDWLKKDSQITIDMVRQKLKIATGKEVSKATMHREIKKMKFSYITARKQHYKQNPEKAQQFKKKYIHPNS